MHIPSPTIPALGSIFVVLLLAGCDGPPTPAEPSWRDVALSVGVDDIWAGTWPPSGTTLNTAWLGVTPFMRIVPPGAYDLQKDDEHVTLVEVLVGDQYRPVDSVAAPGGSLVLTSGGVAYEGAAVVGSRWWLGEGQAHYITIHEVSESGPAFGYQLEHRIIDKDEASPICIPDVDGDHWAYLVADVFVDVDDATITPDEGPLLVACASGALGKAITWGFTPWHSELGDPLLLYQVGVRTVMADYCGDGSSHTEDGILIQVSNELADQHFVEPQASTEAVFGPDGVLCLSSPRHPELPMDCAVPSCGSDPGVLMGSSHHAWTKLAPP